MLKTQKIKLAILICMLLMLCVVAGLLIYQGHQHCMNILLISEDTLNDYKEDPSIDISSLLFSGEKAAIDRESNTVYISQPSDTFLHSSELVGTLASADPEISLYLIDNSATQNIPVTVRQGEPLSLVMVKADSFRKVNVIITSLPVLRLEQSTLHQDETGQDIMTGDFVLWGSSTSSVEEYSLVSGTTQWHIRGQTSTLLPKKSWKLSLKDAKGENINHDLLELGSDDDWILNAMARDDTKLRDKLTTDLWNQFVFDAENDYPMSRGQYVEVIINDAYQGLYLLMRRVDAKYLQLDQQKDVLLKGMNTWSPGTFAEGYEIISSSYSADESYKILENALTNATGFSINLENFIKTNLFLSFCSAPDNTGYKNMFYVLRQKEDAHVLYFVPWDMDMTMGATYSDDFVYDYEKSMSQITHRMEYAQMKERHPQLDQLMAASWQECRTTVYSEATIGSLLSNNIDSICNSGAFDRDAQKWGCVYAGKDTHANLYQWCMEKLSVLDSYYSKIIN